MRMICIDAVGAPELKRGEIYTTFACPCGGTRTREVEPKDGYDCFEPRRFRPLQERKTDISLFTAMLKTHPETVA